MVAVAIVPVLAAASALAQTPPAPSPGPAASGSSAPSSQPPWVMLPAVPTGQAAPQPPPPGPAPGPGPGALPPPSSAPPAYGTPGYPPPPNYYPPPAYYPYGPPAPVYVPPDRRPGYHMRRGLYFRLGFGVAFHRSRMTYPIYGVNQTGATVSGTNSDTFTGTGIAIDAAIGGAPVPGFAIAFDLGGHDVSSLSQKSADGMTVQGLSYSRIGVMLDWYPNPRGGFHVQGGGGFASIGLDTRANANPPGVVANYPDTLGGYALHGGAGWEGWVGADWSIGALLRYDYASMTQTQAGQTTKMVLGTPSLMFSMTFNLPRETLTPGPSPRTGEGG